MKPPPPQVGFNNNVKHRGRVFHIQTEDSGINHPHLTTHLFVDGGRIIKSERSDYSELLGSKDLPELLRKRMKDQHKAMFVALRRGQLDGVIDGVFGAELEVSNGQIEPSAKVEPAASSGSSAPPRGGGSRSRPPVSFARPRAPSLLNLVPATPRPLTGEHPSERSGAARPALAQAPDASSLYGDGKIGEKSLDDVILSYISDDLQVPPEDP